MAFEDHFRGASELIETPDILYAPLDVLVSLVPSLGDDTIDPNLLGTSANDPSAAGGSLLDDFNARVSAPALPGSLSGVLPESLYVFARGVDPRNLIRLGRLGWGSRCHVIADSFKRVLEAVPSSRSEFYPVSVVYRDPAGVKEIGGGDVVRGLYWIWYCYAVCDLIDVQASRAVFETTSAPRHDAPSAPDVTYSIVQTDPAHGLPSLVLRHLPYEQDGTFHVLGMWSRTPFISPELLRRLHKASLANSEALPALAPLILDQHRAYVAREAIKAGKLTGEPPLRIAGTNWTLRDEYEPPFYPERPPYAPALET